MKAHDIFGKPELERIKLAIEEAELRTSGELRVYVEDECKGEVLDRAAFVFAELDMNETDLRNGVLIYLAVAQRKLAIIGDAGIHAKVGDDFWHTIRNQMVEYFKKGAFADGIVYGVKAAGEALSGYFPYDKDNDRNELPNDVVFGKG